MFVYGPMPASAVMADLLTGFFSCMHIGYSRMFFALSDYEEVWPKKLFKIFKIMYVIFQFRMLIADIFIVFTVSAMWTLAFEPPVTALEQIWFKTRTSRKKLELPKYESTENVSHV